MMFDYKIVLLFEAFSFWCFMLWCLSISAVPVKTTTTTTTTTINTTTTTTITTTATTNATTNATFIYNKVTTATQWWDIVAVSIKTIKICFCPPTIYCLLSSLSLWSKSAKLEKCTWRKGRTVFFFSHFILNCTLVR